MPELPEVEITARNLRRWIGSATIVEAHVRASKVIEQPRTKIVRALEGRRIAKIERRGKWMRIVLDDETLVFTHLGMTGRWVERRVDDDEERFEKVRLDVEKRGRRTSVRYLDPRMFGRFVVSKTDLRAWTALGPDPLADEIDPRALFETIARRKRAIKEVLMDQTVIAGVGNIQATDALFFARIDPRTPSHRLELRDVRALLRAVRRSIARTLAHEEGPEITYVEDPGAPNPFVVYGRGGDPCPRCGAELVRVVLGGRGTTFCPRCQPLRR